MLTLQLWQGDRDPSLSFLPQNAYTQSGFYNAASGGLARLANGGGVAEAKAEQMLKMEYQKYRNQGGTMSYQRFKMMVFTNRLKVKDPWLRDNHKWLRI